MAGLLAAVVGASEKAAHVARLCRQEQPLFQLLVAEKTGSDRNRRFLRDFKTLADVLIQEVIKHDLGEQVGDKAAGGGAWCPQGAPLASRRAAAQLAPCPPPQFPELRGHIHGEESNEFSNGQGECRGVPPAAVTAPRRHAAAAGLRSGRWQGTR